MTSPKTVEGNAVVEVHNPATGELIGTVKYDSSADIQRKVESLRDAQPAWEALGPSGRAHWLFKMQDWILDNADDLHPAQQAESGKTRVDVQFETAGLVDILGYLARNAHRFLTDDRPAPHNPLLRTKRLIIAYRPYQVVGVISPWNSPFASPGIDAFAALVAGAAVVIKPSEVAPMSAHELQRGWREIGAPPVLEVLTGDHEVGATVVANVDFVQFTGSTRTGRAIAHACADRLIPCSLELGGKDPAIVLADADLDRAAAGIAWGALSNSGQMCVSVERVYVEASVHDEFVAKLVEQVKIVSQGVDSKEALFDIGAMTTTSQRDIVERHVQEAVAAGAKIAVGGTRTMDGTFFQPTVLIDVEQSMSCIRDETFGPTIPVVKVADEAEAVRLANDSAFGLSATVWTRDKVRGEKVARRLESGAVNINDALANMFFHALPMGGWKDSGIGSRMGGPNTVRKYCRQQAITVPRLPTQTKELLWFPHQPGKIKLMLAAARASGARGRRRFGF